MRSIVSICLSAALSWGGAFYPLTASAAAVTTAYPIQHVVVIFNENESFDHYFGTYPKALNPAGQPKFVALPNTPTVDGLTTSLLTNNPNARNSANGAGASNPFRLNRNQALTADMNHSYGPEQASFDRGAMDLFPVKTGSAGPPPTSYPPVVYTKGLVMGYYDGNTVTAMWNYAQHYALSDNSYNSNFGPSTPGALNVTSGQTNGVSQTKNGTGIPSSVIPDGQGGYTLVGDADPLNDVCSGPTKLQAAMSGKNIGDLLNAKNITWGWFNGGFDLNTTNPNGSSGCTRSTVSPITGLTETDYVPHHQPFQYYASTQNLSHARPSSIDAIGYTNIPGTNRPDPANHQYDTNDWFDALNNGNLPAVSFLKPPSYQDAHPGNSNPLDEQAFIVQVVNALQNSSYWNSTAVIIAYDDSDGWYDHKMASVTNASFYNPSPTNSTADSVTAPGACGVAGQTAQLPGVATTKPVNGRCGPGVRTPLLVISPWAKANFVDHTLTTQSSVIRFIEDNWLSGERIGGGSFDATAGSLLNMFVDFSSYTTPPNGAKYLLNPVTGESE